MGMTGAKELTRQIAGLVAQVETAHGPSSIQEELALLLFRHADELCIAGETEQVLSWFERLPPGYRRTHPLVAGAEALAVSRAGRYREAVQTARELWHWRFEGGRDRFVAPPSLPDGFEGELAWMLSGFLYLNGSHAEALAVIERFLPGRSLPTAMERRIRVIGLYCLRYLERLEEALEAGERLLAISQESASVQATVHGLLVGIFLETGRLARARQHLVQLQALIQQTGDAGRIAHSMVSGASIARWEGDLSEALRLAERAVQTAGQGGESFYLGQALLEQVEVLNLLRRTPETLPLLERLESLSLSRSHEINREIAWATFQARSGRRDLALQRIETARTLYVGLTPARQELLLELIDAAAEAGAPAAPQLLAEAESALSPAYPLYRARLAWQQARYRFRAGLDPREPLARFLTLCEAHSLAGLLRLAAEEERLVMLDGLEAGIASPLYVAVLPELSEAELERVARLLTKPHLAAQVGAVLFDLLARRPDHPLTMHAAASLAGGSDGAPPELRRAAERLLLSVRANTGFRLEVRTFGTFDVRYQGESLTRHWRRKARVLFLLLLLQSPRPLNRSLLAGMLWPQLEPKAAANNLRVTVHELRRSLPATLVDGDSATEWIAGDGDTLRLTDGGRIFWDARYLEQLLGVARRSLLDDREAVAMAALKGIADLCRGPFLPDPEMDEFFDTQRRYYGRLVHEGLTELAALGLDHGEYELALQAAETAVAQEPLDEPSHLLLVRAYSLLGYPHRAQEEQRRFTALLQRESDPRG